MGRSSVLFFPVVTVDETAPSASPAAVATPGLGIGRSIALCAVFYVIFIAASILMGTLLGLLVPSGELSLDMFSAMVIPQMAAWAATIALGLQWAGMSFREACLRVRFPLRIVPALVVASFGATLLLLELAGWIPMPEAYVKYMIDQRARSSSLAILVPLVVVAPVAEEIFFRGLLLRGYLQRYSVTKAVWATAIVFAVFHLTPWQAVIALPLGLWFAWLVLRTGSILPGMIAHATVNFTASFLLVPLATALGYSAEDWQTAEHFPPLMLCLGAAMTVAGGVLHWRQLAGGPAVASSDSAVAPSIAEAAEPLARTDAERRIVGMGQFESDVTDLGSNKKHLDGFGERMP